MPDGPDSVDPSGDLKIRTRHCWITISTELQVMILYWFSFREKKSRKKKIEKKKRTIFILSCSSQFYVFPRVFSPLLKMKEIYKIQLTTLNLFTRLQLFFYNLLNNNNVNINLYTKVLIVSINIWKLNTCMYL